MFLHRSVCAVALPALFASAIASAEEIEKARHFRETLLLDPFRELHEPAAIAESQTWNMNMLLPPEGQGIYEQTGQHIFRPAQVRCRLAYL